MTVKPDKVGNEAVGVWVRIIVNVNAMEASTSSAIMTDCTVFSFGFQANFSGWNFVWIY
jgi:hypothetical protein